MHSNSYMAWDLVRETLIRVPVKSVLRFRSLSKSCNALITSPEFIHSHNSQTTSKEEDLVLVPRMDLRTIVTKETSHTLRVDDNALSEYQVEKLMVLGSCNGLVCLATQFPSTKYDEDIVLWNPCVNKCVVLPRSMNKNCVALGFGFDSDTKDFKVFRVFQEGDRRGAEVYSLRNRSWKAVDLRGDFVDRKSVFLDSTRFQCVYNNVVHHLASYLIISDPRHWRRCNVMCKFDLRHDSVDMVEIPWFRREIEDIFEYDCCLALLESSPDPSFCRVWVLEDYRDMSLWKYKFLFRMEESINDVLGSRKNGEILMWDRIKGLVSYDLETRRINNLQQGAAGARRFFRAFTHAKSLVLVDEGRGIDHQISSNKRKRKRHRPLINNSLSPCNDFNFLNVDQTM